MSLDLDRLRYWLRKELGGLDEIDLDDIDADELLNMSLWALEDKFDFKTKEQIFSFTLVVNQFEYDISAISRLDAIHSISVIDAAGTRHKQARMTRDWLDANYAEDNVGLPVRYLREANVLTLYPIPDTALEVEVTTRESIASLSAGLVTTTGLPRNWDEIVIAGATWRGHKSKGDYTQAQQAANFAIGLERHAVPTRAKEERDSRYARLDVIWDYPEEELEGHEGG